MLIQERFEEMRGVTWRAIPAKSKTGMREMKAEGLRFCDVSWDVQDKLAQAHGVM